MINVTGDATKPNGYSHCHNFCWPSSSVIFSHLKHYIISTCLFFYVRLASLWCYTVLSKYFIFLNNVQHMPSSIFVMLWSWHILVCAASAPYFCSRPDKPYSIIWTSRSLGGNLWLRAVNLQTPESGHVAVWFYRCGLFYYVWMVQFEVLVNGLNILLIYVYCL